MNNKPVEFGKLPAHSLFRIFAEKRGYYYNGEKRFGFVRSADHRVYKKWGNSHSQTKEGKVIILALQDLVVPWLPRSK